MTATARPDTTIDAYQPHQRKHVFSQYAGGTSRQALWIRIPMLAATTLLAMPPAATATETATNPSFHIERQATNRAKESVKLGLLKRVRELRLYEENWDGMGAAVPSDQAIDEAEKFLRSLPIEDIEPPYIALAADGEINFLWETTKLRLDLGIFGDGTYAYFGNAADGRKFYCDSANVVDPLNEEIVKLIARTWKNEFYA